MPLTSAISVDSDCRIPTNIIDDENSECMENHAWFSDYSNSEDDEVYTDQQQGSASVNHVKYSNYLKIL